jgi:hypothetical protein
MTKEEDMALREEKAKKEKVCAIFLFPTFNSMNWHILVL